MTRHLTRAGACTSIVTQSTDHPHASIVYSVPESGVYTIVFTSWLWDIVGQYTYSAEIL